MNGTGKWIGGGLLVIVGLIGLGVSAHAHDGPFSLFGMLLFAFAILIVFRFITLATGPKENA
ncbi:MAG TPA: hypothetical protein VMW18_16550 [Candidatus Binatia bacterium]|nr:hypothetical protein [Candidatus Binatia bacterium]